MVFFFLYFQRFFVTVFFLSTRNLRKVLFAIPSKFSRQQPASTSSSSSSSSSSSGFPPGSHHSSYAVPSAPSASSASSIPQFRTVEESREPLRVDLRIRPMTETERRLKDQRNCFRLTSDTSVAMVPPPGSQHFKTKGTVEAHFEFSRVFAEGASQQDMFEKVGLPLLIDAFEGKDATLMAYGNSGSGKTFTMEGTSHNPGILPRLLDCVFESIKGRQTTSLVSFLVFFTHTPSQHHRLDSFNPPISLASPLRWLAPSCWV